jgi:hypothetical protein
MLAILKSATRVFAAAAKVRTPPGTKISPEEDVAYSGYMDLARKL